MNGWFYCHANKHFVDLVRHTVWNKVCGFYIHVSHAVTDEIKASLRTIWSDSQISRLASLSSCLG